MSETPTIAKPSVLIVGGRGGRPRAPEPGATVCAWLSASDHDRLVRLAQSREQSVSALVRSLLIMRIPQP